MKCTRNKRLGILRRILYLNKIAYKGRMGICCLSSFVWLCRAICKFLFIIALQQVYDTYQKNGFDRGFVWSLLMLCLCLVCDQLCITLANVMTENGAYVVTKGLSGALQKHVDQKGLIEFEKNTFLNSLEQAYEGISNAAYLLNIIQVVCMFQIPYLIFVGVYMLKHNVLLLGIFTLISIPECIDLFQRKRRYKEQAIAIAPMEREHKIYEEMIGGRRNFVETRFWGAIRVFGKKDQDVVGRLARRKTVDAKYTMTRSIIAHFVSTSFYGITLAVLIWCVLNDTMTLAIMAALYTSFATVLELVQNLVNGYLGQISEQSGNVSCLISFLQDDEQLADTEHAVEEDVFEVKNVSFRYPGNDFDSLKSISFRSDKHETIAIVGENGAGKTTLLKVLAGLYDCNQGKVRIGSLEKDVSPLSSFSFVFQNYQKYALSLRENVCFGKHVEDNKMDDLMQAVGLEGLKDKLENGYDTMLTKEFGKMDLSGGQWQRVAIARGLCKDSKMLVLDEPTAAIDPVEESELYRLFLKTGKLRRCFIITHRMGICRFVDRILVLKNGELIEDGNHDSLMKRKGEYYRLFEGQAKLFEKTQEGVLTSTQ